MPSPIAHLAVGYAIYKGCRALFPAEDKWKMGVGPTLPLTVGTFSLLPDIDATVGLMAGNLGHYHNKGTHSLVLGMVLAFMISGFGSWRRWAPFRTLLLMTACAYEGHVLMDGLTNGRGVMAFWPFTGQRFTSPFPVFYGFHWSDGMISRRHIVTLITESAFAIAIYAVVSMVVNRSVVRKPAGK